ncbi:MAG TPA: hypothetical protein VER35_00600 [Candidatus Limnocylindrales bacterium]|nr:hypothetical protein [Candidatus Limnocylindrales bacterium]
MVLDMTENGWMNVSIAMVAVMLLKTCSGRAPAVDDDGNGNHIDAKSR